MSTLVFHKTAGACAVYTLHKSTRTNPQFFRSLFHAKQAMAQAQSPELGTDDSSYWPEHYEELMHQESAEYVS